MTALIADDLGNVLADQIDTLLNLRAALDIPMPDAVHIEALKGGLPEITTHLRRIHAQLVGNDPWADHPGIEPL